MMRSLLSSRNGLVQNTLCFMQVEIVLGRFDHGRSFIISIQLRSLPSQPLRMHAVHFFNCRSVSSSAAWAF